MIYVGDKPLKALYHGADTVSKVYRGDKLVWSASILPPGYTACKYLKSTGTQYIITDYIPQIGDRISVTYQGVSSGIYAIISAGTGDYQLIVLKQVNLYFKYFTTGGASLVNIPTGLAKLTFSSNGEFTINGRTISTEVGKPKSNVNTTIFLFRRANNTSSGELQIYDFAVTGKIHLVPCLDSAGVPCMYDTIGKKTYYNAGTGEFLYEL